MIGSNFKCIKCNEKGELAFAPYPIIDWSCGHCGEWQQEEEKWWSMATGEE
jgi:hypothetical protein